MEHFLVQDFVLASAAILIILGLCITVSGWAERAIAAVGRGARSLHSWLQAFPVTLKPARAARSTSPLPIAVLPARMSRDAQWDRAAGVVKEAIARVEAVNGLQKSAGLQIDSATYAIQRLFAELSGVLPASALPLPTSAILVPNLQGGAAKDADAHMILPSSVHQLAAQLPRERENAAMAA